MWRFRIMLAVNNIYQGDCLEVMKSIIDKYVEPEDKLFGDILI
jgi:DNA modification methylase